MGPLFFFLSLFCSFFLSFFCFFYFFWGGLQNLIFFWFSFLLCLLFFLVFFHFLVFFLLFFFPLFFHRFIFSFLLFFGHHRAACAQAGVLGRRGFAIESVAARICREAGGRVPTNLVNDGRRLEVVVDGLPLFGGADARVSPALRRDGQTRSSEP